MINIFYYYFTSAFCCSIRLLLQIYLLFLYNITTTVDIIINETCIKQFTIFNHIMYIFTTSIGIVVLAIVIVNIVVIIVTNDVAIIIFIMVLSIVMTIALTIVLTGLFLYSLCPCYYFRHYCSLYHDHYYCQYHDHYNPLITIGITNVMLCILLPSLLLLL